MDSSIKYNPSIHHRRSIRLKEYDYSQPGAYFITICTHNKQCRFGKVFDGDMVLNELGVIAREQWLCLTERFINITLGEFVIMPNHMHGIIIVNEQNVGAGFTPAQNAGLDFSNDNIDMIIQDGTVSQNKDAFPSGIPVKGTPTVGDIVGAYKSLVFRDCLALYKSHNKQLGKLWQRNYYEHIIRNEIIYQKIVNYILTNPLKWEEDKYYQQ